MKSKSFAVELRDFRKAQNLTQEKTAEKFDMSPMSILQWENGHSKPRAANLLKIRQIMAEISGTPVPAIDPATTPDATPPAPKAKRVSKKEGAKAAKKQAKAPKAPKTPKAPKATKITKKRAPWGSKSTGLKSLQEVVAQLQQKLDAHISETVNIVPGDNTSEDQPHTPSEPTLGDPVPSDSTSGDSTSNEPAKNDPAENANTTTKISEASVILRGMCLALKRSRVDGEVRGKTKHVVEWPDVCTYYYRAIKLLGIEDK